MGRASESNRAIYRTMARAFGIERPVVPRYYDADEKSHIDVATAVNRPQAGVTSYSTLGLSDYPLLQDGEEYPARLEIVGGCDSVVDWFGNVIATAAFNIINDRHFCAPGVVYPNLVARYDDELDMQHVLFVPPFVWGDQPATMELPDKTVAFLHALPISDAELRYADQNGSEALEDLFEQHQIDVFDIERVSVV